MINSKTTLWVVLHPTSEFCTVQGICSGNTLAVYHARVQNGLLPEHVHSIFIEDEVAATRLAEHLIAQKHPSMQYSTEVTNVVLSYPERLGRGVLAHAYIELNGCFSIREAKLMQGAEDHLYVSFVEDPDAAHKRFMCSPLTSEISKKITDAVIAKYKEDSWKPKRL